MTWRTFTANCVHDVVYNAMMAHVSQPNLVSIVVPCFNAERFLAETLDSAFAQTYPHTEIIVIDDGSTDGTAEVIRSYAGRLTAEFGSNRGASAARNRGTALARGEFIQYLDADDLLPAHAIEHRVAALQKTGADVAYSDWEKLTELETGGFDISERVVRRIEDVHPVLQIALITDFWAPPAALTYRRTIVDKIGGWKEWLPIIQDARFLQDAGLAGGQFVYSPSVGAQYRVHREASLSRRSSAAFVADVFKNACDLQATFEVRGVLNVAERSALASIYNYTARSLFFQDRTAFRECVTRLYEVEQGFRLNWPKVASLASKMLGFAAATTLLSLLTKFQHVLRRAN
jgi:glycosyltransferase involved in cell wall biosynthesis